MIRLKELRKRDGISQKNLAKILGVDQSAITKWETGKNGATQEMLLRTADLFSVSVSYLLGDTDDQTKKDPQPVPGADQMDEQMRQFLSLVEQMTDEERKHLLSYMEFIKASKTE